ncbi:MAG: hypothetical protein ABEJ75_00855 [Candidatus Nanohaloarchaea archaeon]
MGTWIGFFLTLPLAVLSGLLVFQIHRKREEVYARLSFKSLDVRIAFQLVMVGFIVLAIPRMYDALGLRGLTTLLSVLSGSITTVLMVAAFVILDAIAYGPDNWVYYRLPSNYFGEEAYL